MKADKLAELGFGAAEMMFRESGEVLGMVVLHADNKVFAMPYKNCRPDEVDQQRLLIICTVKAARKEGVFEGMVMLSEAWVAEQKNPALMGVLRPALDPDRKEILLVHAYGDDGKSIMVTADILRKDGKAEVGPRKELECDVKCWLDAAFND